MQLGPFRLHYSNIQTTEIVGMIKPIHENPSSIPITIYSV